MDNSFNINDMSSMSNTPSVRRATASVSEPTLPKRNRAANLGKYLHPKKDKPMGMKPALPKPSMAPKAPPVKPTPPSNKVMGAVPSAPLSELIGMPPMGSGGGPAPAIAPPTVKRRGSRRPPMPGGGY